ncbi:M23 family metallopeptidase [Cellulomonas sp. KH9]|uniref:M23 family metallopeptidase n=1 Tax=Cellulomonas sp. KH9 TaxID=1855324 RepID=UPI0008E940A4|nr:M23 family metallopeptidase [Cellulomonas sp. KH9]SFK31331.1 Peptidase family M23 [Cellulomonas sp. KH9]
MAWIRPAGAGARFTSDYGPRSSPGGVGSTWHRGIDLAPQRAGALGFPVLAATDGTVLASGYSTVRGYWLVQRCTDGSALRYQHFAGPTVGAGASLRAGQVLGAMGATGAATGPHLHLECFEAGVSWSTSTSAVDPEPFFRARGVNLRSSATTVSNPGSSGGGITLPDIITAPIPGIDQEDDMPYSEQDLKRITAVTLAENLPRLLAEALPTLIAETLRSNLGDGGPGRVGAPWWVDSSDRRTAETLRKNIGDIAAANPSSWWAVAMRSLLSGARVDEQALAQSVTTALVPAVVSALADETDLTEAQVEAATERVLRRVLGGLG